MCKRLDKYHVCEDVAHSNNDYVDDDDDDDGVVVDPIADDAFRTSNCGSSICTVVCHEHFREVPGAGQLDTMF